MQRASSASIIFRVGVADICSKSNSGRAHALERSHVAPVLPSSAAFTQRGPVFPTGPLFYDKVGHARQFARRRIRELSSCPSRTPRSCCATRCATSASRSNIPRPNCLLRDWGIRSTIVVFGSARTPSPEQVAGAAQRLRSEAETGRGGGSQRRSAYYYAAAREFGRIASERGGAFAPHHRWRDNVIATGGGPGIMEAANRGAVGMRARPASASTSRCRASRSPIPTPRRN